MGRLSSIQRFWLVLAAGMIGLLVAWQFAVARTVDLAHQCGELSVEIAEAINAEQRLAELKGQINEQDGLFGSEEGLISYQQELFETISRYCSREKLLIHSFPAPVQALTDGFLVETSLIVLEGDFKKMLKLVHELETEQKIGNIAGLEFQVVELFKEQQKVLRGSLYVQFAQKL